MFNVLESLDKSVTLVLNSLGSPLTDRVWQLFSMQEIWYVLYLFIAFLLVRRLG